jgi:hypothetical protein
MDREEVLVILAALFGALAGAVIAVAIIIFAA